MQRSAFFDWLVARPQQPDAARSRAANCATVERERRINLDALSDAEFLQLRDEFRYSKADQRAGRLVRHGVPIDGDQYTGTATLRVALKLYYEFRFRPDARPALPGGGPPPSGEKAAAGDWPQWEAPSEDDSLLLASVLARHARFLHPDIVRAIVEDNKRHAPRWRHELNARGVPADAYLWERSPCAFPGVRRYSGSDEIAIYRGRKQGDGNPPKHALALDDNDYPKHLWSCLFRGRPFQKHGPKGYNLAHLADHKDHNNRAAEDFAVEPGTAVEGRLHGLYSCPTNTVFVPAGLLKPTDFHPEVRSLFIRKAQQLYGSFCEIVPSFLKMQPCRDGKWDIGRFEWAEPVGDPDKVSAFLEFRKQKLDSLLAQCPTLSEAQLAADLVSHPAPSMATA